MAMIVLSGVQFRFVNTPLVVDEDVKQTMRVRTLQSRIQVAGIWTPWETVPEFDAEDIEEAEEQEAQSNAGKSIEALGL